MVYKTNFAQTRAEFSNEFHDSNETERSGEMELP